MRMTFPGGDTKLMTFTDVKPNAPVDPAWFTIGDAAARPAEDGSGQVSRRSRCDAKHGAARERARSYSET